MKKAKLIVCYLLGWAYPLSVSIVSVFDIRTKLGGAFDFGNDSIIFYMFWSLVFAVVTFGVFFYYIKTRFETKSDFFFTLFNIPLYFVSIYCELYTFSYPWISVVTLVLAALIIAYTVFVTVKRTKDKTELLNIKRRLEK